LKIGIVGAGMAGMAAALFLSRDGHDVTLFERVAEPGPVGPGCCCNRSDCACSSASGSARRFAREAHGSIACSARPHPAAA
jgi:2-polyprenyl-6-methoxyphenol hydroxylase-like FAD-dependent oxidoreductase